jgi:hypothetical protein
MTIENLEKLFERFASIFLLPLVNLIFLSMIVYVVSGGISFSEGKISGISSYLISLGSDFLKGDISANIRLVSDLVSKYGKSIANASTIVLAAIWVILVMFVYLVDRLTFYVGYFVPPMLEFDLDQYGVSYRGSPRVSRLSSLVGKGAPFAVRYGAIRAYLGDKNVDKYRLEIRGKLTRSIDRVRGAFSYSKAYLIFCFFILGFFAANGRHVSPLGFAFVCIALVVALLFSCLFYANLFKQLIEYDIDSFIADRSYNKSQPVKAPNFSKVRATVDARPPKTRLGALLRSMCIRLSTFEKLNT